MTAAEAIMTALTTGFYGRNYVDAVELLQDNILRPNSSKLVEVDARTKGKGKITFRDAAIFYGHRPKDERLWYLSPYEFVSEWDVQLLHYPRTLEELSNPYLHADLTEAGTLKLLSQEQGQRPPELYAGIDYEVKDGGEDWMPFPDVPTTKHLRHVWIIKKRRRPHVPTFMGSPVPSKRNDAAEHSAVLTMAYFHPWTLRADEEEGEVVPYAGSLRSGENTWEDALNKWLNGNIVSQEALKYVGNLLSVYRVRPRDPNDDARSDEDFDDEKLVLDASLLERAMRSRVGGKSSDDVCDVKELMNGKTSHEVNSRSAMDLASKLWPETDVRHCNESLSEDFDKANLDKVFAAAKASQRKDKRGGPVLENADKAPVLKVDYSATCPTGHATRAFRVLASKNALGHSLDSGKGQPSWSEEIKVENRSASQYNALI